VHAWGQPNSTEVARKPLIPQRFWVGRGSRTRRGGSRCSEFGICQSIDMCRTHAKCFLQKNEAGVPAWALNEALSVSWTITADLS
jgi:hypothetical protein